MKLDLPYFLAILFSRYSLVKREKPVFIFVKHENAAFL